MLRLPVRPQALDEVVVIDCKQTVGRSIGNETDNEVCWPGVSTGGESGRCVGSSGGEPL